MGFTSHAHSDGRLATLGFLHTPTSRPARRARHGACVLALVCSPKPPLRLCIPPQSSSACSHSPRRPHPQIHGARDVHPGDRGGRARPCVLCSSFLFRRVPHPFGDLADDTLPPPLVAVRAVDVYGLGVVLLDLAHTNTRAGATPPPPPASPAVSYPLITPCDIESGHGAFPRDAPTADGGTTAGSGAAHPVAVLVSRAQSGWAVDVSPSLDPAFRSLILVGTAVDPRRRPSAAAAGASLRNLSAGAVGWPPLPEAEARKARGACGGDTPTADAGVTGDSAGA